jgi:hypothetical protein
MITDFRHRGFALLALLLVMFVSGGTLTLGALNNRNDLAIKQHDEMFIEMENAKATLLSYASNTALLFNNSMGPGFFPCPDTDNDGEPQASCDSDQPLVGRLPEYVEISGSRFEFSSKYAGVDQQFWLIVAPRYIYYSNDLGNERRSWWRTAKDDNSADDYRMKLDGSGDYVALLIAPGEEMDTQTRSSGTNTYTNYIDGKNGSDGFNFYRNWVENPELFNDYVIGITHDEYMLHVGTAVAKEILNGLEEYHDDNGSYPYWSSTFEGEFDGAHTWLRRSSLGNRERWANTPENIVWARDSSDNDRGVIYFDDCPGMTWYLNADNDNVTSQSLGSGIPEC